MLSPANEKYNMTTDNNNTLNTFKRKPFEEQSALWKFWCTNNECTTLLNYAQTYLNSVIEQNDVRHRQYLLFWALLRDLGSQKPQEFFKNLSQKINQVHLYSMYCIDKNWHNDLMVEDETLSVFFNAFNSQDVVDWIQLPLNVKFLLNNNCIHTLATCFQLLAAHCPVLTLPFSNNVIKYISTNINSVDQNLLDCVYNHINISIPIDEAYAHYRNNQMWIELDNETLLSQSIEAWKAQQMKNRLQQEIEYIGIAHSQKPKSKI